MRSVRQARSEILILVVVFVLGPGCRSSGQILPNSERADMKAADIFPNPPLRDAARSIETSDLARLRLLVRGGAPVNGRGNGGATLLMYAIGSKKKDAVTLLLRMGADPNLVADAGLSAMMLAAGSDDGSYLRAFLDAHGDPNLRNDRHEPITFTAAAQKRWDSLRLLLDRGAQIDDTDRAGITLMIYLAEIDEYQPVLMLLERGADFRKVDSMGRSLAILVQKSRISEKSRDRVWLDRTRAFLESRGVRFPVAAPHSKGNTYGSNQQVK